MRSSFVYGQAVLDSSICKHLLMLMLNDRKLDLFRTIILVLSLFGKGLFLPEAKQHVLHPQDKKKLAWCPKRLFSHFFPILKTENCRRELPAIVCIVSIVFYTVLLPDEKEVYYKLW